MYALGAGLGRMHVRERNNSASVAIGPSDDDRRFATRPWRHHCKGV